MSNATCRGSLMLGSGCGKCDKCKEEIAKMKAVLIKCSNDDNSAVPISNYTPGWVCPKCGAGNAPFSARCPCVPIPMPIVTC